MPIRNKMRSSAYRREAAIIVEKNQNDALNTTMCIVQNFGPMGFLIQEENENKKYKVFIGERHTCTCKLYSKQRDLCKHICWVLLKKFKLNKHDPISWQNGLSDRELSKLLEKSSEGSIAVTKPVTKPEVGGISGPGIYQRSIESADICPICQDEFLSSERLPVTYCRKGCGNNVHIKCIKIWKDHQTKERNMDRFDFVSCPICRGDFAKLGDLNHEIILCENRFSKSVKTLSDEELIARLITRRNDNEVHKDTCYLCSCSPITGQIYCLSDMNHLLKINKSDKVLCSKCFNKCIRIRTEEKYTFYWKDISSSACLHILYMTRQIRLNVYLTPDPKLPSFSGVHDPKITPKTVVEALTKPLSRGEVSKIPKWIIKAGICKSILGDGGRKVVGHALSLLAPGQQCRICLMHFQEGEEVRNLLNCNHVFHSNCVDPWLRHLSPCCPLDGQFAAPLSDAPSDRNVKSKLDIKLPSSRNISYSLSLFSNTNMGDVLKITSITNTVNNAAPTNEARGRNYPINRHSSSDPKSSVLCPGPHIHGSIHLDIPIGPVCKSVQIMQHSSLHGLFLLTELFRGTVN
ncbi:unnamed protein product [Hymenolepis diminuta]|uniref:SWIM-type domain-containing protein n=1 Tax=Hymenolepis diminuta TaxID=6216 RepID=A0A3P6WMZ4_HYMDI|nr:unnamed protein product [Hymenolepis diminuta]